jgi:hypothetical protein
VKGALNRIEMTGPIPSSTLKFLDSEARPLHLPLLLLGRKEAC